MYCLLFFDDWHLHSRTNLDRHTGDARMNPEGTLRDPYADTAWGYPSVIQDPESGKWRCYYQGEVPEAGRYIVPQLAESDDGVHWELPDLSDKIDLPDRQTPNQLFGTEKFREWCGMYQDPQAEGTDEWLKAMITYTHGPGLNLVSYVATSGDGMKWTPHEDARWHPTGNDPGQFAFWNPHRESYVLSFRPRVADRRIALSETKDWKTFTRPELALQADALDTPSALIYGMPVFPYEQMFVALPWMYHTDPIVHPDEKFQGLLTMYAGDDIARIMGKIDAHVAYSTNGWHFQRTVREPLIPNGPPGDPSSGCIYPSSMVEFGDTLRFYSSASKGEHAQFRADPSSGQGSILLHELAQGRVRLPRAARRDGRIHHQVDTVGRGRGVHQRGLPGRRNTDAGDGPPRQQDRRLHVRRLRGVPRRFDRLDAFVERRQEPVGACRPGDQVWREGVQRPRLRPARRLPVHHHAAGPQLHPERPGTGGDALLLGVGSEKSNPHENH